MINSLVRVQALSKTFGAFALGLIFFSLHFSQSAFSQSSRPLARVNESYQVIDPDHRWLPRLARDLNLTVDHPNRLGFELYGPKGTGQRLKALGVVLQPLVLSGSRGKSWSRKARGEDPLVGTGYPHYEQVTEALTRMAAQFPQIARLESIGKSVNGRDLWVLKISDHVERDELEPEVKIISSMHGDEITGREMLVRLAQDLLTQYGRDPKITELIDSTEIYLMPSMNPDGSERMTRGNANGIDLNRSFPNWEVQNPVNSPAGRPPEVQAVMAFQGKHHFALSANFHGGAVVVNYPWDAAEPFHPFDRLVRGLSLEYASHVPEMVNSQDFENGVTNGYRWYPVYGGMQDWSYVWYGDLQVTVEVSGPKWPDYAEIPRYYRDHRNSMVQYLRRVHQGAGFAIGGDSRARGPNSGPVSGQVQITRLDSARGEVSLGRFPFWGSQFYKVLDPGRYRFEVQDYPAFEVGVDSDLDRSLKLPRYVILK